MCAFCLRYNNILFWHIIFQLQPRFTFKLSQLPGALYANDVKCNDQPGTTCVVGVSPTCMLISPYFSALAIPVGTWESWKHDAPCFLFRLGVMETRRHWCSMWTTCKQTCVNANFICWKMKICVISSSGEKTAWGCSLYLEMCDKWVCWSCSAFRCMSDLESTFRLRELLNQTLHGWTDWEPTKSWYGHPKY